MLKRRITIVKKYMDRGIDIATMAVTFILFVVVVIQVTSRYVFNRPTVWTEELARYLFIWIVFLGIYIAYRDHRHLRIDYLVTRLSGVSRRAVEITGRLVLTAFLLATLWYAPGFLRITARQPSPTLRIPMALIYAVFPLSSLMILLHLAYEMLVGEDTEQ